VYIASAVTTWPCRSSRSSSGTKAGIDFVALRGGLALGNHCLGLVQDGGQEVNGFLVAAAAATYGLAVNGQAHQRLVVLDRVGRVAGEPDTDGVVEGVTVDQGQQTAQGGGAREAAEPDPRAHVGGCVRGEPGDAGQGGRSTHDREQAQGEQRTQPLTPTPYPPRIRELVQRLVERGEFLGRAAWIDDPAVALQDTDQGG
jgi:hypothetical protein